MSQTIEALRNVPSRGRARSVAKSLLSRPAVFGSLIPVVTLLNAVVGLLLPQMMEPRLFGEYSLVVTLFNYGLIFDLGISQVIDRRIPAHLGAERGDLAQSFGDKVLWLRLEIGIATLLLTGAVLIAFARANMLPFSLAAGLLAALAGLADMVALGPACIFRARSARRNYAILIATLLSGLIVARLGGFIAGGLVGCFAALALWYVGFAVAFHTRMPLRLHERPGWRETGLLIRQGVPFFATSFIWAFYVTGNRWFASLLIEPEHFGQFAFSANIFSLLVGAAGGFSAFYYPKIAQRIASSPAHAVSRTLTRDLCGLTAAMVVVMAVGIVLSGTLVGLIYPRYLPSVETARVILVAVPPMILASWLMPVSLSGGDRPWIDGVLIYPLSTLVLGGAIFVLYRWSGEQGAAWASTVGALPLIGMQLAVLCHAKILRTRDAQLVFAASAAGCVALGLLAWGIA